MRESGKKMQAVKYIVLTMGAILMLAPFAWMILTAFKTTTEATQMNPFVILPKKWTAEAFVHVCGKMNFIKLYRNTLLMIAGRILCAVATACMAGYAFGRLHFKGRSFCFALVLFQMMVPSQIFVIPQYLMLGKIKMLGTIFSLIFPGLVTAFGTFLMRQAFMGLPAGLEEAAWLDGCNIGQTFFYIMAPLAKSSMVALGIFTALFGYKELLWPLVANTNENTMPLAAALAKLQGQFVSNYPELMAASVIACLPMLLIYLLFQRRFIEGIAASGSKL